MVMVRPQRGHRPLWAAQVVPQFEHWATFRGAALWAGGQAYTVPVAPLAQLPLVAPSTLSKAQEDWGNKGREKNSSFLSCCQ